MRNNPKHGTKLEYQDTFIKQARIEKIRRFFNLRKQKIYKHFCVQPNQANFLKKHIRDYLISLDGFLQMEGQLVKNFNVEEHFGDIKPTDSVQYELLFAKLRKWATEQTLLDYDVFAKAEDGN